MSAKTITFVLSSNGRLAPEGVVLVFEIVRRTDNGQLKLFNLDTDGFFYLPDRRTETDPTAKMRPEPVGRLLAVVDTVDDDIVRALGLAGKQVVVWPARVKP